MEIYMGYHRSSETFSMKRDIPDVPTPVDRGLEILARETFDQINESGHIPVSELGASDFPLEIFYGKYGSDNQVNVRIRTQQNKVFYSGPYLPVFQAVKFAKRLQHFLRANNYGCEVIKEVVQEE
jgi:hypothetical protein